MAPERDSENPRRFGVGQRDVMPDISFVKTCEVAMCHSVCLVGSEALIKGSPQLRWDFLRR